MGFPEAQPTGPLAIALLRPVAHPQPSAASLPLLTVQGEANQSLPPAWQFCRAATAGCKWLAGKHSYRDSLLPTAHAEADQVSCHESSNLAGHNPNTN